MGSCPQVNWVGYDRKAGARSGHYWGERHSECVQWLTVPLRSLFLLSPVSLSSKPSCNFKAIILHPVSSNAENSRVELPFAGTGNQGDTQDEKSGDHSRWVWAVMRRCASSVPSRKAWLSKPLLLLLWHSMPFSRRIQVPPAECAQCLPRRPFWHRHPCLSGLS